MKKLSIVGLSDHAIEQLLPLLVQAKCNFFVESLDRQGPAELSLPPKAPKAPKVPALEPPKAPKARDYIAEAKRAATKAPKPGPGGAYGDKLFKHPTGITLAQFLIETLLEGPITREDLRDAIVREGWKRNTLEPQLSKMNRANLIAYDYEKNTVTLVRPNDHNPLPSETKTNAAAV